MRDTPSNFDAYDGYITRDMGVHIIGDLISVDVTPFSKVNINTTQEAVQLGAERAL